MHRVNLKLLCALFLFIETLVGGEFPLIEEMSVTKDTIRIVPNKRLARYCLRKVHTITYNQEGLDLRRYDSSLLIMPFIFDLLPLIYLSGDNYIVDELDTKMVQSLEKIKRLFIAMYPNTTWKGSLLAKRQVYHELNFDQSKTIMLFSGGIDSTYSLIKHLDQKPILFTLQGHIDASSSDQWRHTIALVDAVAKQFELETTRASSKGAYVVDRLKAQALTKGVYDWSTQIIGDLRWIGKLLPIMVHLQASKLCIPASISYDYPFVRCYNSSIDNCVRFGSSVEVFTDGFDQNRIEKISYILKNLNKYSQWQGWRFKICFDPSGENCNRCFKCVKTISCLYLLGSDPNLYGFNTTMEEFKKNLLSCYQKLSYQKQATQESFTYALYTQLRSIEDYNLFSHPYAAWFYSTFSDDQRLNELDTMQRNYYERLETESSSFLKSMRSE